MKFTLVSTIFNEANRLELTIEDLENQSVKPDEIIITDAGSTDGTIEIVKKWQERASYPIKLLIRPSCNVAEGRNFAIKNSSNDIIVSTDFGCRFHVDWLKTLIERFNDEETLVVCGKYSVIEKDQVSLSAKAAYVVNNGYKIDITSEHFIPSSRSIAYKRQVFDTVGGYCEWLTLAADDSVFGMELLANNFKFSKVDIPYVYWGRHSTFRGYGKEAFRYGLGEGEARIGGIQCVKILIQLMLRICAIISLFVLISSLLTGKGLIPCFILFLIFTIGGYRQYIFHIIKPWYRLKSDKYDFKVLFAAIFLFEVNQLNFLKGYLKGYFYSSSKIKREAKLLRLRLKFHNTKFR